jgi:hypothetical protein
MLRALVHLLRPRSPLAVTLHPTGTEFSTLLDQYGLVSSLAYRAERSPRSRDDETVFVVLRTHEIDQLRRLVATYEEMLDATYVNRPGRARARG